MVSSHRIPVSNRMYGSVASCSRLPLAQAVRPAGEERTIQSVRSARTCTRLRFSFLEIVVVDLQMMEVNWTESDVVAWVQVISNRWGVLQPDKGVEVELFEDGVFVTKGKTNDVGAVMFKVKPPRRSPGIHVFTARAKVPFFLFDILVCETSVQVTLEEGRSPEVLRMTMRFTVIDPFGLFDFQQFLNDLEADLKREDPDTRVVREESSFDGETAIVVIESPAVLIAILAIVIVVAIILFLIWIIVREIRITFTEAPPEIVEPTLDILLIFGIAAVAVGGGFFISQLSKVLPARA